MSRTLVTAGVHLDRAWTELGSPFGTVLRPWSREILARLIDEARRRDVETILVVGDLLDRATVLPETVEYAAAVLGSFPGNVLVVPGATDWIGDHGPYEFGSWADNTHVWTKAAFEPSPTEPTLWGSAWTSPASRAPRLPSTIAERHRVFVRPGLSVPDLDGLGPVDRAVTSGTSSAERALVVPDLVHQPGVSGGWALLVDTGRPDAPTERVPMAGQPGTLVTLDVTGLETTEDFEAAIRTACSGGGPIRLRLLGELPTRILLPGYGGPVVAPGIVLDVGTLAYAVEVPQASDRSTKAEFLRAMAMTRGVERERHQATALGIAALNASSEGE